jgi:YVTN family beta-propeller protein
VRRIATVALLLASLASGQWLGEKLSLLDTFGIPAGKQSLVYINHNRTVLLSGGESDSIVVIDADRCKSVARFAVGGWGIRAMGYNPVENKLYGAYTYADTVVVLDGTTHQILARVGVGDSAGSFCYDYIDNKMYVGNQGSASVTVIDCADDHVVATIDQVYGDFVWVPSGMCFVAAHKTVYVASWEDSSVVVIDCLADTTIARIPVGGYPEAVCYSPTHDRVYCACWGADGAVYGIDAALNQVVSVVQRRGAHMMACDPARNVLFIPNDDVLTVVDCSADTVVAEVQLPRSGASLVGYDPANDKVYVAHDEPG